MTVKIRDWPRTALVCGVLSLTLWASQAQALSLGRVLVSSLLGEPLRAEIDFLDISADEAATLSAAIASQEAFQAVGISYGTIVSAIQVTVQKRADGQPFIRLMSSGAINDSFIDLVLEAKWSNGRLLRDYTLLFAQAKAGTSPKDASPDKTPKLGPDTVTVRSGDTAGAIALSLKPPGVSLDQMLVALLRANPGVFLGENVNRIQAGAVLVIPTAQQSAQTPAPMASRIIAAQSQDFNDFRRKFAAIAQATQIESQSRQSSGTVQAKLEDQQAGKAGADKLTLAKNSVEESSAEDRLAKERTLRETASRADELARNINELSKLSGSTDAASSASAPASAGSAPVLVQPVPALPSASAPASAPQAPASSTQPAKSPATLGYWAEHPLVPWLAAGLLTLLTSLLAYRLGQRRQNAIDSVQPAGPGSPLETLVMRQKAADQEALRTADEAVDRPALAPMLQQPEPPPMVLPEPTQPAPDPVRAQADLEVQALPDEAAGAAVQDSELDPRELDLEFEPEQPAQRPEASQQSMPTSLDSLSLDLDDPPADRNLDLPDDSDDPLQTKLDLAEEFRAIGDEDGARSLIEEVIAGASGDLLSKAERALGRLK
ncbi:hypothetical protein LBMAG30_10790 [Comamonadaceae bacterium]|nr:hypothetical protein LBMAG30_10790 [Comamonadaceae bacterium]